MPLLSTAFTSSGVPLAAHLHLGGDDLAARRSVVVVTGSWLTVKEQMPDRYAAALAERGYAALTFDFAGFGASGGDLRQTEMPLRKAADLRAAVDFARSLSFGTGPVGVLAVCASAQYTVAALADGLPAASFVSVAGWFHDLDSVAGFYGGAEGMRDKLAAADRAARDWAEGRPMRTVPAYAAGDAAAGMSLEMDYYANPSRGALPTWRNEMTELTWGHWLTFDGLAPASSVATPTLFVHSDDAVFPDHVRQVADAMAGPVETVWADGEQTDFYDRTEQVGTALDAADRHFRATLEGKG